MEGSMLRLSAGIQHALQALEFDRIQRRYWAQNECVVLEHFLPDELLAQYLLPEVEKLRANVHRSYIPRHKKGGSVSYYTLVEKAPAVLTLYRHPAFIDFLSQLVGAPVMPCPEDDPHACALYFYTERGDHIGFHYDTSYYQGARYTVLVGLVQRSQHCQLVGQLYKGDPTRARQDLQLGTHPGTMVIFNGDKLFHAVTPLEPGAERIMLSMEYVTNLKMGGFKRFISNMKDAIAYFGVSALWRGRPSARRIRTTTGNLPFSQAIRGRLRSAVDELSPERDANTVIIEPQCGVVLQFVSDSHGSLYGPRHRPTAQQRAQSAFLRASMSNAQGERGGASWAGRLIQR